MKPAPEFGDLTKSMITDIPANLTTPEARDLKKSLLRFPEEAVYIYSFKENRMIYADGWEAVLGYKDDEVNMLTLISCTVPKYAPFSNELNDEALRFIQSKRKNLQQYSFSIELKKIHKNGTEVPLVVRVGVHMAENGKLVSIIGRYAVNRSLRFGNVMRYASYGSDKNEFEDALKESIFYHLAISDKERDALAMAANGLSFKEIAHKLKVSTSAIEKRINPLYKRFDVKSLTHLVNFAKDNHIID
jgi:DNA-binding CsgD family transcriptional regulator